MRTYETGEFTLEQVREHVWELPQTGSMNVPARVLANESLLDEISDDRTLQQLRNTTELPGIQTHALCMPDGHQGYGFPVGGVAAIDAEQGCISPGAVGYDINCGVRLLRTNLTYDDLQGNERELVDSLFEAIPCGLGSGGVIDAGAVDIEAVLERGVEWAIDEGYGVDADLAHCEDHGRREDADPSAVSQTATNRGKKQVGSLGSGNHFLEVQRVTDVFDPSIAEQFGLTTDQIVVLIHTGSRGLGHQVCTDYLEAIETEHADLLEQLPDDELAAAPADSRLAREYYGAMCAAINFAWVNRQVIAHETRRVFESVFERSWEAMEIELLYDVAHNSAKLEPHTVDGEERELFVHRKGSTRAFPAGRDEIPAAYQSVGQPVLIPGSMGTGSYVLCGSAGGSLQTFGSTAHGAGRIMSRTQAKQEYWGGDVQDELEQENQVFVKADSGATIAEEAPGVYKDIDDVVAVSESLGIGTPVARLFPVCNVKG